MAIATVIDLPGGTAARHDALVREMGIGGQSASAIPGLIFHVAGPIGGGWRVIDVWESEADLERFQRERLAPAAAKFGGMPPPQVQVMPVHRCSENVRAGTPAPRTAAPG
jgi:hypothetical protein